MIPAIAIDVRPALWASGICPAALTRISSRIAFAVLLALQSIPTRGQNLLVNPDFTTNGSGWTVSGSGTFDNASGSPTPGSFHLSNSSGSVSVSQCVSPFTPQHIDLFARFYSPTSASLALVSAVAYDGLNCTGSVVVGTTVNTNGAASGFSGSFNGGAQTWNEVSTLNQGLTTLGIQSVQVAFGVLSSAGPAEDVWFDLIRFGPAATLPVTLQEFHVD